MHKVSQLIILFYLSNVSLFAYTIESPIDISLCTTVKTAFSTYDISRNRSLSEKKKIKVIKFIDDNKEQLQVDIAKGEGEVLDTYGSFYDISDKKAWRKTLQENYNEIFFIGKKAKSSEEVYSYLDSLSLERSEI
jgi:hypothetical protein